MSNIQDVRSRMPFGNSTRSTGVITKIVRHHSATTSGDVFAFLRHWQGSLGWRTGGYHEVILRDGTVQLCYNPNQITNGARNQNTHTYHICLVGNGSFTEEQEKAFVERVLFNMNRFNLQVKDVVGHRELPSQNTQCPGINMNIVRTNVQAELNRRNAPTEKPIGKATINANVLNVRSDSNISGRIVNQLRKGQVVDVYQVRDKWLRIGVDSWISNTSETFTTYRPNPVAPKPVVATKPTSTKPTLRIGSRGNDVKELQKLLNNKGYRLVVDGVFGRLTENAVKDFQQKNRLTADGVVGQKTWSALEQIVYTVKSGDTLWRIAGQFSNVSVDDIKRLNPRIDENNLQIGQKIVIK